MKSGDGATLHGRGGVDCTEQAHLEKKNERDNKSDSSL